MPALLLPCPVLMFSGRTRAGPDGVHGRALPRAPRLCQPRPVRVCSRG